MIFFDVFCLRHQVFGLVGPVAAEVKKKKVKSSTSNSSVELAAKQAMKEAKELKVKDARFTLNQFYYGTCLARCIGD